MSIGGALAQARQRAGLSVAQVSQRSRIRETIIVSIERDDYSACGSDFYARGHIRAIATVVGTDPEPLIGEYDAACRAPGALPAVSLEELLTSAKSARPGRHRPVSAAMAGLVVALALAAGFVAYQFQSGSPHAPPVAAKPMVPHRAEGRGGMNPSAKTSRGPAQHAPSRAPGATLPWAGLAPVSAAAAGRGGGNPAHASLARRQARDGLAHRLADHRPVRESVSGHRPAAGHGPSAAAHRRADQTRHRYWRSHPDRGRHRGPTGRSAHGHAHHAEHRAGLRHGRPSRHGHAQR
jgi:Helix-turn-helix domain